MASSAMLTRGWRTVVSAGEWRVASAVSSKPLTATSCGTVSPAAVTARAALSAIASLAATIASTSGRAASSSATTA